MTLTAGAKLGPYAPMGTIYDVSPDGQSFIIQMSGEGSREPLNLVTDWTADLKK
jgi:hypothetical protein